ncbi:MAG: hypothetical protein KGJ95_09910, partial [Candidatus Omnitrophica bacterium]|nr:hypothetical protein [Candidatus Omnitrophota bacterium]
MEEDNERLKIDRRPSGWTNFAFLAFFVAGVFLSSAWAQYSGGNETTDPAESSIGSDIYNGGAQNNSPYATSGSTGTLSYGTPAKLVFTVSPSDTNHSFPFARQPVVAVEDAYGNIVTSDNTDQVTVTILSNPGAGGLMGTATVNVVNGLAQFTNLGITAAGQLYTLQATSPTSPSLTPGISATFNINPGTGPVASAVWDNGANAYYIFVWGASDNAKEPFSTTDAPADSCAITIYNPDGTTNSTPALTADTTNNWCKSSSTWTPGTFNGSTLANGYTAKVSITGSTPCGGTSPCTGFVNLPLTGSGTVIQDSYGNVINWEDIGVIKANTDKINWADIAAIKAKTDTVNWQDVGVLQTRVSSIYDFTQLSNSYGINWNSFA